MVQGPFNVVVINDFEILKSVMDDPKFEHRAGQSGPAREQSMIARGGHGRHGIITNSGQEWKEQRRFTIHHLKDFGFGKSSMEGIIINEANELCEQIRKTKDKDFAMDCLFNATVLNVLWNIVAGKRYDISNSQDLELVMRINRFFAQFGTHQLYLILYKFFPKFILNKTPRAKLFKSEFSEFFKLAETELKEHLSTYDPQNMRDFVDCYIREMKRAEAEDDQTSSFYKETGKHNFNNVMFDLFLAGSETSSTTLKFAVVYLINNPKVQTKLQAEIDKVVGQSRPISMADKPYLPYLNAVIAEVQRCGQVAPFAVQHFNHETARIGEFVIPPRTMVIPNLSAIMLDPALFPNPKEFRPERNICQETGEFKPHPALIPFGIGRRYCLGKNMAAMELFLILGTLMQQFSFAPSAKGIPNPDKASIALTRSPCSFYASIIARQ